VIPGLTGPYALALNSAGTTLVVGYTGGNVVQLIDTNTLQTLPLTTAGLPLGVWMDTNGDVYVAEQASPGRVEVFSGAPNYILVQTITSPLFSASLRGVLKQGSRLFVSDYNNSQVYELDDTGSYVFTLAQVVINGGFISNPTELSTDIVGNLYVASTGNSSVVEYKANSTPFTFFKPKHTLALPGYGPQGVATDSQGYVYAGSSVAPYQVARIAPCEVLYTLTPTNTATNTPTNSPSNSPR